MKVYVEGVGPTLADARLNVIKQARQISGRNVCRGDIVFTGADAEQNVEYFQSACGCDVVPTYMVVTVRGYFDA